LETESEKMNKALPPLKEFILPGGSELSSRLHFSRTECRDTERTLVSLGEVETVPDLQRHYLNRLSDYLFILARKVKNDEGSMEVPWDYNK
jgi:cob(I)alamin adenosyltransferase